MTPLETCIAAEQAIVDSFSAGTKDAPKEGTIDWFSMHSHVLALAWLKEVQRRGISGDTAAVARLYRSQLRDIKGASDASQAG